MKEKLEYIGTISGTKGFRGEINVSDVPVGIEKLKDGCKIGIGYSDKFVKYFTLASWSSKKNKATLKLVEIKNEIEVKSNLEKGVFVNKDDILTKEIGLTDEIIGCKVVDYKSGEELGKIVDVWYLPANNVWYMRMKDGHLALPVIDDVIKNVDLENDIIKVNLIPGLIDIKEPFKDEEK